MRWHISVDVRVGTMALSVDLEGGATPMALVGPNGSGKTTLLRTIAGAHRPVSGRMKVGRRLFFDSLQRVDLSPEARRVGYVPQGCGLFPHLRVVDNVAFGLPRSIAREKRRTEATELLEKMDCSHLSNRWPAGLSGGERQRVALARALMIDPEILLLDEPLSALDASSRRATRAFLAERLAANGAPAIVVTHDLRDVLALRADVCVLENGKIIQRGTAESLAAQPATDFVAEFFLPWTLRSDEP